MLDRWLLRLHAWLTRRFNKALALPRDLEYGDLVRIPDFNRDSVYFVLCVNYDEACNSLAVVAVDAPDVVSVHSLRAVVLMPSIPLE